MSTTNEGELSKAEKLQKIKLGQLTKIGSEVEKAISSQGLTSLEIGGEKINDAIEKIAIDETIKETKRKSAKYFDSLKTPRVFESKSTTQANINIIAAEYLDYITETLEISKVNFMNHLIMEFKEKFEDDLFQIAEEKLRKRYKK